MLYSVQDMTNPLTVKCISSSKKFIRYQFPEERFSYLKKVFQMLSSDEEKMKLLLVLTSRTENRQRAIGSWNNKSGGMQDLFEHFRRINSFGITVCGGKHALSPQPEIRAHLHERTKA